MAPVCDSNVPSNEPRTLLFGSQDTVNVEVGPEERRFTIHRDLLRHCSPYFSEVLDDDFKELRGNVLRLREPIPDVFELFVAWLYAQRFDQRTESTGLMTWPNLAHLYVFADKRGVSQLKDALISVFVKRFKQCSTAGRHSVLSQIPYIYANTKKKSLLRKLLVDYVIFGALNPHWLTRFKGYLTADFLFEVTLQMKENAGDCSAYAPYTQSTCRYHEHGTGQPCDA